MSSCTSIAYITDCRLLRALARVLDLSAVATTTAFTYLHKIRLGEHACQLTGQELVTACIYVAAKVEEVNVSANQLINSARLLCHPSQQHLLQTVAPYGSPSHAVTQQQQQQLQSQPQQQQQPNATVLAGTLQQHAYQQSPEQQQQHIMLPSEPQQRSEQQLQEQESIVVTGDAYYAAKDRLFTAEQVVLRLMNFQLRVQQPHKQLLNFCKLLHAPPALAAAAVCLLNDAVAYTGLCISHAAAVVAAAALQLAARWLLQSQDVSNRANSNKAAGTAPSRQQEASHGSGVHTNQKRRVSVAEQHHSEYKQRGGSSNSRRHSAPTVGSHRTESSAAAAAAVEAIAEGAWISLVGLQQGDVDQVIYALQQLLQQHSAGGEAIAL